MYFIQSKNIGFLQFIDIGDNQWISIISTWCDHRIIMWNIKNFSNIFSMNRTHAVVTDIFFMFF